MTSPVHHQFSITPGDSPGEVHVVCEQHDESRWHGPRRTLLILSVDAIPELLHTLQGHLPDGADVVSDL